MDLTQFPFDLLRYLVLLYYNPQKMQAKVDAKVKRDEIERLKKKLETETSISMYERHLCPLHQWKFCLFLLFEDNETSFRFL